MSWARSELARRLLLLIVALLMLPMAGLAQSSQPNTISEPPIQWPRSHPFHLEHIELRLSFDWQQELVLGEATLQLRPFNDGLSEIALDAADFQVESVKLDHRQPLKFQTTPEQIQISLGQPYRADQTITVTIKYRAHPKQGLRFIKPTASEPDRPYQIWSQGESSTNHYWFPCYDFPNDRTTSDTIITVESRYTAISNGALIDTQIDKAHGLTTYHWRMDQPYSSYLASVIVGEFSEIRREIDGIPVIHYVYQNRLPEGQRSFASVPEMIKFYSSELNCPYPFAKYAETTVYDFGGGMENITATTLTDGALKDERAMLDTNDSLSAHELAHQWFGDLLTCHDWSELWLNEGFASFFAALWLEHSRGQADYQREILNAQTVVAQRYSNGRHRPMVTRRYQDPDELFDENNYDRGTVVLHMLRVMLGDNAFHKAIRHYVASNRVRNVTTTDLAKAIEESTGENLDWFFDQWVYKMGIPELEITTNYDEREQVVNLKVKQLQKNDEKRPWFEVPRVYRLPLTIAITTREGSENYPVVIDRAEQSFSFPATARPLIINFDRGNTILKLVHFNRASADLLYQLTHDDDLTGRWRAARELQNLKDEKLAEPLANALNSETSALVRQQIVIALSEYHSEAARLALLSAINDADWQVRNETLSRLGEWRDQTLLPIYQKVIETEPSYRTVTSAAIAAGQTNAPAAVDLLLPLLKQDSWQDTLAYAGLQGLSFIADERALKIGLDYATPGHHLRLRNVALALLGARGKGNHQALELINKALTEKSLSLSYAAIGALRVMGDPAAIESLEKYLQQSDIDPGVRNYGQEMLTQLKQPAAK